MESPQPAAAASEVQILATFHSAEAAETAAVLLGSVSGVGQVTIAGTRDSAFILWFLAIVVVASILGTALGVGIGLLFIALGVTPNTTESLILQVVTWAIFWHLLIGLIAGYALLADRTNPEWRPGRKATLEVSATSAAEAAEIEAVLKKAGARTVARGAATD